MIESAFSTLTANGTTVNCDSRLFGLMGNKGNFALLAEAMLSKFPPNADSEIKNLTLSFTRLDEVGFAEFDATCHYHEQQHHQTYQVKVDKNLAFFLPENEAPVPLLERQNFLVSNGVKVRFDPRMKDMYSAATSDVNSPGILGSIIDGIIQNENPEQFSKKKLPAKPDIKEIIINDYALVAGVPTILYHLSGNVLSGAAVKLDLENFKPREYVNVDTDFVWPWA